MDLNENTKGATTSVNAFEVFYGAYRSERKTENTKEVIKLLEKLFVIPLDLASSRRTAELLAKLAEKGQTLDYRDAMIAGVVLENDLTLVTRNTAHFKRINGLKLEKW
jgi:tRNA(fMet)-specific endonuclease VapC